MTTTLSAGADQRVIATADEPAGRLERFGWASGRIFGRAFPVLVPLLVLLGVVVRFTSHGDLWLDEALTVNISRLPPGQLFQALRVDGSPPLYYLVLHVWMDIFGTGTHTVRALSGIFSTLALIPTWFLGRRLSARGGGRGGGRQLAVAMVLLMACAPFALRFGSETRMYSLVLLEVCLSGVAVLRAIERPTLRRLSVVTLLVLALALTHYWTFFVLIAAAIWLLVTRSWRVLGAFVAASVLFAPQLPTLLFQLQHTGTPWAPPTQPRAVIDTLLAWGGPGTEAISALLGALMVGLALLGAVTVREGGHGADGRLTIDPRRQRQGMTAAGLGVGTLVLAVAATMAAGAGFVERYTAIAVPGYTVLVALGLLVLPARVGRVLLVAVAAVGLFTGRSDALRLRTQAGEIASALAAYTAPGDVIVYCPDQLAPAVHRVAPSGRTEISYGDDLGPTRVNWVDYAQHNAQLDPTQLAARYDALAGPHHQLALVFSDGYRTLEGQCSGLANALGALRPVSTAVEGKDPGAGEQAQLRIYASPVGVPGDAFSNPGSPGSGNPDG